MATTRNLWLTQDTLNIKRITNIDVSPDGKRVAFTVTQAAMTTESSCYISQVYLADSPGSPPRQITAGEFSSFAPQWSPDGRSIAFLSRNNIWLMSLPGENLQKATDVPTSVSSFKWSPDGSKIAFTAADEPTPEEEQAVREKNDPRVDDRHVKKQRLYLVSLAELDRGPSRGQPLTGSDIHVGAPEVPGAYTWSPDGKTIVFAHCRSPQPNDWPSTRLGRLNLEDGSIQPVGPDETVTFDPVISPDGQWLAYKVYDHPAWEWASVVHILPLDGGPACPLAGTHDRRPDLIGWSADGKWLHFLETYGTHHRLCALPVDGNPPVVLLDPEGCIENASLNKTCSALGFTLQTTTEPPEVYLTPLDSIAPVQMSHVNAELHQIPIGRTEVIHWKSVDGLEIEGLLTYPIGYEKGKRYPLLVSVHGGPANAWMQFFIGMQSFYGPMATFASYGYAILRCNVRGSTGYGKAFRLGNYRDWGGKDVQDLLAGVDYVIDLGVADPERLGITGWSYGGYLTAATITQTGRFKAAVIGAGMTNLVSYSMGNDSPSFLASHFGGEVWEVADLLLERSPVAHADTVTTPTLILHGEHDQRVPIWQGYEFYNALKRCGIPTQMVVYPRTGHVPSEPKLLLDVMNRILAWMEQFLKRKDF
jgi:dipeptidyl aminopeptidase/acylaminoacyl peptidase